MLFLNGYTEERAKQDYESWEEKKVLCAVDFFLDKQRQEKRVNSMTVTMLIQRLQELEKQGKGEYHIANQYCGYIDRIGFNEVEKELILLESNK